MCFSIDAMKWIREPRSFVVSSSSVEIVTEPHTDLWQNTYYHFCNDNAPVLFFETSSLYFSFVVKTDFSSAAHRFDQCGIVLYQSSSCWLKASVEYESASFGRLGSVVTNGGYSDWATTDIPTSVKTMWYRLSRRESDFCIENSSDGVSFSQMRICHLSEGEGAVRFGIYACSPEDSSFTARFSPLAMLPCAWEAHDGQQPDQL